MTEVRSSQLPREAFELLTYDGVELVQVEARSGSVEALELLSVVVGKNFEHDLITLKIESRFL